MTLMETEMDGLEAARQIGLDIPTLCHLEKCGPLTSCLVCLVKVAANGQSRLIAQWTIKRKDQPAIDKRSDYRFPASSTDYDVMVKAQSQCLSKLSQEIAETIRQLMLSADNKQSIRIR